MSDSAVLEPPASQPARPPPDLELMSADDPAGALSAPGSEISSELGGTDEPAKRTTKRKKKRKKANATATGAASASPAGSTGLSPQRITALPISLTAPASATAPAPKKNAAALTSEIVVLRSELEAAIARADDAEVAEAAVNKGLLSARSVIAQRDKALADAQGALSDARAEAARLRDERKWADRQLSLLRTVSANLQEAREARDAAERRGEELTVEQERETARAKGLEGERDAATALRDDLQKERDALDARLTEARAEVATLREEVARLRGVADSVPALKGQLVVAEGDLERMRREMLCAQQRGQRQCVAVAGVSAAATLACVVAARAIGGGRRED